MSTSRRSFFRKSATAVGALTLTPLMSQAIAEDVSDALLSLNKLSPSAAVNDDELWARMSQAYTVSPNILNLNNGGVSPQPKVVQDAVDRYYHLSNEAPTYYMWQILDKGREPLRRKLADLAGTLPDELAINRNATESLVLLCHVKKWVKISSNGLGCISSPLKIKNNPNIAFPKKDGQKK